MRNNGQASGRILLLLTGIAYVILGVFSVVTGLFFEGAGLFLEEVGLVLGSGAASGLGEELEPIVFILLIFGVWYFVIGIMGIAYRNELDKAGTLLALGIIDIVIDLFFPIIVDWMNISIDMDTSTDISTILFFAIPIFYIIGAYKNKRSLKEKGV